MPAQILPNIAQVEKHLMSFSTLLTKPQYQHFKGIVTGMITGRGSSVLELTRYTGAGKDTLYHFFNESCFNDHQLLTRSAQLFANHTPTRSTQQSYLILDFTSTDKTGRSFEWADWLWNEETDEADNFGHEQLVALEYDPVKQYRRVLGYRRFYHQQKLKDSEYWDEDFEKKPVVSSRLTSQVKPLTRSHHVLVDGAFISGFLVNHFERLGFAWTGRIRKSLKINYQGKTFPLKRLLMKLESQGQIPWQQVTYRKNRINAFALRAAIPSLKSRQVTIAVCRNKKGRLAFIGSSRLDWTVKEIVRAYAYRWEIEVFFKDLKGSLPFNDYKLRSVGANTRRQILTLVVANILELVAKIKLKPLMQIPKLHWLKRAFINLYRTSKTSLKLMCRLIADLRSGGHDLTLSLKRQKSLNIAKIYLYRRVNVRKS